MNDANAKPGASVTRQRIVLVRHGRSAHVHAGWIDYDGFVRWREAYEAAGLDAKEVAPPAVRALAAEAGAIVASDAPRAIESARLLAPDANAIISPLVRELDLVPPVLRVRLPLVAWALVYGVRMLIRAHEHITPAEHERAAEAARWLDDLSRDRGTIVVVTHATFRSLLARTLPAHGWRATLRGRRTAHWSIRAFEK